MIDERRAGERGVYFVFGAVLIAVLLIIIAIVFGLGRVTADKARLQAVNNLMALAAIEGFMDCTSDTTSGPDAVLGCTAATYAGKANAALAAANKFAQLNSLQGAALPLGDLDLEKNGGGPGGAVSFGRWVQEAGGPDTCSNYPCFIENANSCTDLSANGCGVNAVRVRFNTQPNNMILVPLGRLIGTSAVSINTVSTSSVIPRCAAFVLDASGSSFAETNLRHDPDNPVGSWESVPAIRSWPEGGPAEFDCGAPDGRPDAYHWCTYMSSHNKRTDKFDGDQTHHYRSDYSNSSTRPAMYVGGDQFDAMAFHGPTITREKLLFDRFVDRSGSRQYDGPQPLVSFLKAFNAGIQQMRRQSVGGDVAAVIGLRDTVLSNPVADSAGQLSSNFGFLLQLTNPDNRGTFRWDNDDDEYEAVDPEVRPNFLDADWFPHFTSRSGTDLYGALSAALATVSTCPTSAKKMIIIASDGIPNCSGPGGFPCSTAGFCSDCDPAADNWSSFCNQGPGNICADKYTGYMYNEHRLLDLSPGSLLTRLIEAKVSVTMLIRGSSVRPNFINVQSPTTLLAMDQTEAKSLNYGGPLACPGGASNCALKYFDYSSGHDRSDYSTKSAATPFLRPNGLMGDIVFRTGGIWCPLQNPLTSNSNYHDVDGIDTLNDDLGTRQPGTTETRPLYNLSIGGQAIKCIKDTIGGIPFTLVEGTN